MRMFPGTFKNTLIGIIALATVLAGAEGMALEKTADEHIPILRNNPFIVPAYVNAKTTAPSLEASQGEFKIRSVLLSKTNPLVNVNGVILGMGEEIDGYQLTDLDNEKAVFVKNGNEITIYVREKKETKPARVN